ncbi:hydroxylamine reductase [Anaerosphaera multitolerans]|uniref:Hydroxylamine reductase n=1 Tax=Anaerosphaera multitolerans TaxID=2487351 RepID=A0A437S5A5_9FIRM|nr:hydroxylamine reductase [Anaerosphaera multitolerans]RVU54203.1 hydroxylamine reductase [Anaerosphaera multitolerans]
MGNKMFCYQCQETAKNIGCTEVGVCGKNADVANKQDMLIWLTKGISEIVTRLRSEGYEVPYYINEIVTDNLFTTITNANFDEKVIEDRIILTLGEKENLYNSLKDKEDFSEAALYSDLSIENISEKSKVVGVLSTSDEDIKSLRELIVYGLKGLSAYTKHAEVLLNNNEEINIFIQKALAKTLDDSLGGEDLINLVLETGKYGVLAMEELDKANTKAYGNPEITKVNIGVRNNPGILISGHDLRDMEMLLKQSQGSGVDIYTHSEMLPANYYPEFKKYDNFVGNYGNAWWKQREEFESFNGPILMTTNCIVPPKESYQDRLFTTGMAGFPGCKHIDGNVGEEKDFSELIELAKRCESPKEIETGEIIGGFAHNQVFQLADKIVDAVKSGAIKKFVVMAGCDGRQKGRNYYSDFAKSLPKDSVILTAGCAKYRYNKLNLGDIGGIPRVLDAGQCNDSYSLVVIALKLKEIFNLKDINELPIIYNIAWYEQKAVIVLLSLLYLGVKDIHLGPTLPGFLSKNVADILVREFGISGIGTVEEDIELFFPEAKELKSSIDEDFTIGQLVMKHPETAPVLMSMGMHCLGCPASQNETLKEASMVHGFNLNELLDKINEIIIEQDLKMV